VLRVLTGPVVRVLTGPVLRVLTGPVLRVVTGRVSRAAARVFYVHARCFAGRHVGDRDRAAQLLVPSHWFHASVADFATGQLT
jgi:hypothetical protein